MRGKHDNALKSFRSLPGHYGPSRWTSLESRMLSSYLTTPLGISGVKDEAWVESGLAFLRSLAISSSTDTPLIRALPNMDELVTALLNDICSFVGKDAPGKICPGIRVVYIKLPTS